MRDFLENNNNEFSSKDEHRDSIQELCVPMETNIVNADLNQFKIVELENRTLEVSHPAFSDAPIGIVTVSEYNRVKDKARLLSAMLSDAFSRSSYENHYSLKLVGSFSEPTIVPFVSEPPIKKEASFEDVSLPTEYSMDDLPLAASSDSLRQQLESSALKNKARQERLVSASIGNLSARLQTLFGFTRIAEIEEKLELGNEGLFSGEIVVSTSIDTKEGIKLVAFPIEIKEDNIVLPSVEFCNELVSKSIDLKTKLAEELAKETLTKLASIDADEVWKEENIAQILHSVEKEASLSKEADIGGVQYIGPQDTLKLNRHLLDTPDLEIGDEIYADGFTWKLTSKTDEQLSKGEDEASLWTFTKVAPTDEEPKTRLGH